MNEHFFEECLRCGEQIESHETVWQVGAPRPKRRFFCRPCRHGWESGVAEQ